jgi:hypothetical protein
MPHANRARVNRARNQAPKTWKGKNNIATFLSRGLPWKHVAYCGFGVRSGSCVCRPAGVPPKPPLPDPTEEVVVTATVGPLRPGGHRERRGIPSVQELPFVYDAHCVPCRVVTV